MRAMNFEMDIDPTRVGKEERNQPKQGKPGAYGAANPTTRGIPVRFLTSHSWRPESPTRSPHRRKGRKDTLDGRNAHVDGRRFRTGSKLPQ